MKSRALKITIVGCGKMGEAFLGGLLKTKQHQFCVTAKTKTTLEKLKQKFKTFSQVRYTTQNAEACKQADIVVIAVKPSQVTSVSKEIRAVVSSQTVIVSLCAAVTIEQLEKLFRPKQPIIRAMPNLPCLIGEGVVVLSPNQRVSEESLQSIQQLFKVCGLVTVLDESLMDAVTGVSGCGPAYFYLIIEALSEAGVKVGLPRQVAMDLVIQTMQGSVSLIQQRGKHPAEMKDEVTTPAGCTIDGLLALEEGNLRATLIKAVVAATQKSRKL